MILFLFSNLYDFGLNPSTLFLELLNHFSSTVISKYASYVTAATERQRYAYFIIMLVY